jgi:hypothetical protein
MCTLLINHALAVILHDRPVEATALLEYAARLAARNSDSAGRGRALLNLCYVVAPWDLQAAVEAARASVEHCRRVGAGSLLVSAVGNLADSLIWVGDWDGAAAVLAEAGLSVDADDGLSDDAAAAVPVLLLAALRGDPSARPDAAALRARISPDDALARAQIEAIDALVSEADGRTSDALDSSRRAHQTGASFGLLTDFLGWSWPVASRAAHGLHDADASQEMLAMLDGLPVGRIPPQLRAERDLARARLASADDPDGAAELFTGGVRGLRALGSPYHLAHGLLDHATFLASTGQSADAAAAIDEASRIAETLGARPLATRVTTVADRAGIVVADLNHVPGSLVTSVSGALEVPSGVPGRP